MLPNETDEKAGVLKVLLDPASERILGASIVGAEAGRVHPRVRRPHAGGAIVDMEEVHPRSPRGFRRW
jgi:pyruvate/2-oxoglutarate dehydrogenase complex dihydrolipoamide dehydrogenase (E3) component